jgi:hypothetical protein
LEEEPLVLGGGELDGTLREGLMRRMFFHMHRSFFVVVSGAIVSTEAGHLRHLGSEKIFSAVLL